nr:hypothetical protein [Pedobacter sp. ASV19]
MDEADQIVVADAKAIILKYGLPGYSLVGKQSSDSFSTLIEFFSDKPFRQQVVNLMEKEMKRHNASAEDYARVVDSILFSEGKMQTYGTHLEAGKSRRLQAKPIQIPRVLTPAGKPLVYRPQ